MHYMWTEYHTNAKENGPETAILICTVVHETDAFFRFVFQSNPVLPNCLECRDLSADELLTSLSVQNC